MFLTVLGSVIGTEEYTSRIFIKENSYMAVNDPESGTSCKGESACCLHCTYPSIAVSIELLKACLHFEGVSVGMNF
ncbi:hypothetical protein GJ496_001809 [Pomphorhynchus laevis]|nr:hypothetical protein GJ496_001809 [Pomphorhynchus laevis]